MSRPVVKVTRKDEQRGWLFADIWISVLAYALIFDLWDWLPILSTHRERFFYGVAMLAFTYPIGAVRTWIRLST